MKRLIAIVLVLMTVIGCSTDFDLTADYEEVMVVYGLLNQNDDDHYIRIHKGYLDEERGAFEFSDNPDSIYYPDILNVTITELDDGRQTNQWTLDRINGDTLNPPISKNSDGLFSENPNILYRFSGKLRGSRTYRLRVENKQTGKVATSSTDLVGNFNVVFPISGDDFPINWTAPNSYVVRWSRPDNSEIYDLNVTFHYEWKPKGAPNTELKKDSFNWSVFSNRVFDTDNPEYLIPFESFLQAVDANLDPDTAINRYFRSLEFRFTVGTPLFADFINYSVAQSGITQDQATPYFSNVDSAIGLFSARYDKYVRNVKLSPATEDSLANGSVTGDLQFVDP